MKAKKLSEYLGRMRSARDKKDFAEVIRLGESASKNMARLAGSAREKYLFFHRLGLGYYHAYQYSLAISALGRARSIALEYRLKPEDFIYCPLWLGLCFQAFNNTGQSLRYFLEVRHYFARHPKTRLSVSVRFLNLIGLSFCYLARDDFEKVREVLEEMLPLLKIAPDPVNFMHYYRAKGICLTKTGNYPEARQVFQELLQLSGRENVPDQILEAQFHLAVLDFLEDFPGTTVSRLNGILREAGRLKNPKYLCEALLMLSKCYRFQGAEQKAVPLEKRLKTILNKVDIVWFYDLTKAIEQLFLFREGKESALSNKKPTGMFSAILTEKINGSLSDYQNILVGKSPVMLETYQLISKVAPTDLPVLIYGETGAGKELAARAIHQKSLRSERTWLACNTGAIPETLLESELFGYFKGAFTGAQTDKKGYIELASGGTLFLDEVGNMSLGMQQKLLRVMEDNLLWRVGAEKPVQVNTRFVFASNENLESLVREKRFREDLYYRMNTIIVTLPPLRERKEDIPLLVDYFLKKYAGKNYSLRVSDSALRILNNYPWPGNVRELENEIKRICVLYPQAKIIEESMIAEAIRAHKTVSMLSEPAIAGTPADKKPLNLKELRNNLERNILTEILQKCNGNITKASVQLSTDRTTLSKRLKQLNISPQPHQKRIS